MPHGLAYSISTSCLPGHVIMRFSFTSSGHTTIYGDSGLTAAMTGDGSCTTTQQDNKTTQSCKASRLIKLPARPTKLAPLPLLSSNKSWLVVKHQHHQKRAQPQNDNSLRTMHTYRYTPLPHPPHATSGCKTAQKMSATLCCCCHARCNEGLQA